MDNKTIGLLCGLSLFAGVLAGSMLTHKKLETIYQDKLREDLDEARENRRRFFMKKTDIERTSPETEKISDEHEKVPVSEPDPYKPKNLDTENRPSIVSDKPYVISPEEFGEMDDYERIVLMYHTDGVLTDEDREIIDDPDEIVGKDYADHFGKYDSVYVRNDKRKSDYEILKVLDSYDDILEERPWLNKL